MENVISKKKEEEKKEEEKLTHDNIRTPIKEKVWGRWLLTNKGQKRSYSQVWSGVEDGGGGELSEWR